MHTNSNDTIKALFNLLAQDSESALQTIAQHCESTVMATINKIVHNSNWAKEVWNDCIQTVWENRKEASTIHHPIAWLISIARNKSINKIRDEKKKETFSLRDWLEAPSPIDIEKEAELKSLAKMIAQAVNKLPAREQQVFKLRIENGLSRREVANLLNLSEHTVKNHFQRACLRLRKILQQLINSFLI